MHAPSIDGEVKLWDLRRSRSSLVSWSLCPEGLAAFDVHEQCSVFAAYVSLGRFRFTLLIVICSRLSSSPSSRQRDQIAYVHSLHALPPNQPRLLSSYPVHTSLHHPPQRGTSTTPSSSLAFHPHEMLFGIGAADGTIRLVGCKLVQQSGLSVYRDSTYQRTTQNGGGYFASIRSATP